MHTPLYVKAFDRTESSTLSGTLQALPLILGKSGRMMQPTSIREGQSVHRLIGLHRRIASAMLMELIEFTESLEKDVSNAELLVPSLLPFRLEVKSTEP
jgi:hypothetical protein